ncbi:MAG: disulfide bond formation protein B [Alphaproteobacteria bacterium]|nr:disulfide bond formation protein B [Alphaproteobacteria bacterium]
MIQSLLNRLTMRRLLLLQALAAAFTLSTALIAQYGFHLYPCDLCLKQRYPYAAIIAVGLIGAACVRSSKKGLWIVLFCTLLFALDAGIAFYHTGVELDIFKGPDACSSSGGGEQTLEEMRAAIMNAPLVSCKQAMAYFWGISMAAWNGLAASMLVLFSIGGSLYVRRRNA